MGCDWVVSTHRHTHAQEASSAAAAAAPAAAGGQQEEEGEEEKEWVGVLGTSALLHIHFIDVYKYSHTPSAIHFLPPVAQTRPPRPVRAADGPHYARTAAPPCHHCRCCGRERGVGAGSGAQGLFSSAGDFFLNFNAEE